LGEACQVTRNEFIPLNFEMQGVDTGHILLSRDLLTIERPRNFT